MSITEPTEAPSEPTEANAEAGTPSEPVEAADQEPTSSETYTIKVDGEEIEVTLDELQKGYSRTKDYTKKTQELATERKRLAQYEALGELLEKDPEGTLRALQDAYKVSVEDQPTWDEMDPQEQRLARIEKQLADAQARDARSYIDNEFSLLEKQYGEIDRREVAMYALKHDLSATDAYKVMHFDPVRSKAEKLAEEQAVLDQKRNATLPHRGASAQRGSVTSTSKGKLMSVREAYAAALKQAG